MQSTEIAYIIAVVILIVGLIAIQYRKRKNIGNAWLKTQVPEGWHFVHQGWQVFWLPGGTNRHILLMKGNSSITIDRISKQENKDQLADPKVTLDTELAELSKDEETDDHIKWTHFKVSEKAHKKSINEVSMAIASYELDGTPAGQETFRVQDTRVIVSTAHGLFRIVFSTDRNKSYDKNRQTFDQLLQSIEWSKAPQSKLRIIAIVFGLAALAAVAAGIYQIYFM